MMHRTKYTHSVELSDISSGAFYSNQRLYVFLTNLCSSSSSGLSGDCFCHLCDDYLFLPSTIHSWCHVSELFPQTSDRIPSQTEQMQSKKIDHSIITRSVVIVLTRIDSPLWRFNDTTPGRHTDGSGTSSLCISRSCDSIILKVDSSSHADCMIR